MAKRVCFEWERIFTDAICNIIWSLACILSISKQTSLMCHLAAISHINFIIYIMFQYKAKMYDCFEWELVSADAPQFHPHLKKVYFGHLAAPLVNPFYIPGRVFVWHIHGAEWNPRSYDIGVALLKQSNRSCCSHKSMEPNRKEGIILWVETQNERGPCWVLRSVLY